MVRYQTDGLFLLVAFASLLFLILFHVSFLCVMLFLLTVGRFITVQA